MKKLVILLSILSFLIGCTDDIPDRITQDDFPKPPTIQVVSSTIKNNMEISPDHEITLTFNNSMDSVNINISGISGNTVLANNKTSATFHAFTDIPEGIYTLTVTGKDEYGQELQQDSITFSVKKGAITPIMSSLIAFSSNRDSDYEIYVMKPDGSGVTQLTNNFAQDTQPVWSLDGRFIAFSSDRDGIAMWNSDIIVMRNDGSAQTNLTNTPGINESNAFWSWDGKMVGFMTDMHGALEYYIMNIDGTNMRPMEEEDMFDFYYPWMFDDKYLFWDNSSGNYDIYLDSPNVYMNLTNNLSNDTWGSWSPDGKQIVFMSDRDFNNEIYIMNADGSGQKRITFNFVDDSQPCWSPF